MKDILFNRFSPFLLLLHWVLALAYFPLWRVVTVSIHPFNEPWQTQTMLLADLPAIAVLGVIGEAFKLTSPTGNYLLGFALISLQWILIGCLIKAALFCKKAL